MARKSAYQKLVEGASKNEFEETISIKETETSAPTQKVQPEVQRASPLVMPLVHESVMQDSDLVNVYSVRTGLTKKMARKAGMNLARKNPKQFQIV